MLKQGIELRRTARIPFRLEAVLSQGGRDFAAYTDDVSLAGVYLRTEVRLEVRWLVRLRLKLPDQGDELVVMGMAARQAASKDGGPPGVGIQLYSLTAVERRRWSQFIEFAAGGRDGPAATDAPEDAARRPAEPSPGRVDPRFRAVLQVRLQTVDDVRLLYTRNVSKGGLFVGTTIGVAVGSPVKVRVIHPRTGEHFTLEADVRWRSTSSEPGLGLEFVKMTEQRRDEFLEFIGSEVLVEEVAWVADGDPAVGRQGPPAGPGAAGFTRMAPPGDGEARAPGPLRPASPPRSPP